MFYTPERFDVALMAINARFGDVVYPQVGEEPLLAPLSTSRECGHIVGLAWLRREMPTIAAPTPKACELALLRALNVIVGTADELAIWRQLPEMSRVMDESGNVFWRGWFRLEVYQMTRDAA